MIRNVVSGSLAYLGLFASLSAHCTVPTKLEQKFVSFQPTADDIVLFKFCFSFILVAWRASAG